MRVPFAAIVVASVALLPRVGQASSITLESLPPSVDAGPATGYSLVDASGDPILLLSAFNTFDPPDAHDKLRGGPRSGGIVFTPIGGFSNGGAWTGFGSGGPLGGGAGNQPPGLLPPGSFIVILPSLQNRGPDQSSTLPLDPVLNLDFNSGPSFSLGSCCEPSAPAVPEPSTLVLVGGGVLIGLRRLRARS